MIGELLDLIYGMSNIADELSREIEKTTGLTKNHALAIKFIASSSSTTLSELVKRMHLNPATMVRILNNLEDQGLISRARSNLDRRVVHIELTDKAKKLRQSLLKISQDSLPDSVNGVGNPQLLKMREVFRELTAVLDSRIVSQDKLTKRQV